MWCGKCDKAIGYEGACGYGDYKCTECGTMYWADREYDEFGDEIDDEFYCLDHDCPKDSCGCWENDDENED